MMNKLKRIIAVTLMSAGLFCSPVLVMAQEGETPPDTSQVELVSGDSAPLRAANTLANAIAIAVYVPAASGFVIVLTSITKRFLTTISAPHIALFYMLIMWVIYVLVRYAGLEQQFGEAMTTLTQLGYTLLGVTGTPIVTTWLYNKAAAAGVPIVGFSRTPQIE